MPKKTRLPMLHKVRHKVATYLTSRKVGQKFTSTSVANSLRQYSYTQRNYVSKALVWYAKEGWLKVLNPEVHAFRRYEVIKVPPLLFTEQGGGPHISRKNESDPPKIEHVADASCCFTSNKSPKERLEALEDKVATLFDMVDGVMEKVNGWL